MCDPQVRIARFDQSLEIAEAVRDFAERDERTVSSALEYLVRQGFDVQARMTELMRKDGFLGRMEREDPELDNVVYVNFGE